MAVSIPGPAGRVWGYQMSLEVHFFQGHWLVFKTGERGKLWGAFKQILWETGLGEDGQGFPRGELGRWNILLASLLSRTLELPYPAPSTSLYVPEPSIPPPSLLGKSWVVWRLRLLLWLIHLSNCHWDWVRWSANPFQEFHNRNDKSWFFSPQRWKNFAECLFFWLHFK